MFRPFQERKECPDRYENASKQQKKRVDESTCKSIGDVFFNEIDEEKFACLYSDVKSRPNIPVRILVTAMLLIRLFGITPGFFLEMLQTGALSFQYALHTTAFLVQPLSERTLERFVSRLRKYKKETGQDLLYEEFQRIAIKNGIKMKLLPDPEEDEYQQWKEEGKRIVLRMDSFMCALHGKHMNRLELVYTANMINLRYCVSRDGVDSIPEELRHYLNENDHNAVIYYRAAAAEKEEIQQSRLQRTFDEMLSVKKLMEDLYGPSRLNGLYEYQMLNRVLEEQSVVVDEATGKRALKDKKDIRADSTQNIFNPFMTYRFKYHANYGASVNIVDVVDGNGNGQIIDCAVEQSVVSDQEHLSNFIDRNPLEAIADEADIHADGGYETMEGTKKAEEAGFTMQYSNLSGKAPDDCFADFQVNEETGEVEKCCCGKCPYKQKCNKHGEQNIWMEAGCCQGCEHEAQCKPTYLASGEARIKIGSTTVYRAKKNREIKSESGKAAARKRNSIEGVVSTLRRRFKVDSIQEFDIERMKPWLWVSLMGYNVIKYERWERWVKTREETEHSVAKNAA